jgi:hypothetical protein
MTSSSVKFDLARRYPVLGMLQKLDFVMQDEAQQYGSPDDAVVSSFLNNGLAIHIGDRKQPSVFIDRKNPDATIVIEEIARRQVGIKT